ncbi:hypothetical protein MAR_009829 [Mya arenaria]|uniref:BTB domain-containing protein n=1 Tax=Mya arenaria TaxID=6604 RepID=A0ABY7E440_MYAAR|nr:hypothetical protein MAR_009829 [Mya arenaria]
MDFNKKNKKSVSTSVLLRKQVEEQSDFCDFTVRHGLWSKRYHACVVCSSSAFIQAMMRNNFNEKAKGFLELKLGCAPKLSMENVSAVIHMAEFLLIPNLKAFCMSWINKEIMVDEENVETFLHLTSFFDIEMPTLTKYIRQHLPELLMGNQLLTLTVDTIENMFLDETLSYVTADAKIDFVMR